MRRIVRPYVAAELDEAPNWYDERSPGLGRTFIEEVELTIRRAPVRRFPYGCYYAIIRDAIHVLAVVHDARHPSVWKRRR